MPAGLADFVNEPITSPKAFAETKYKNIVQYSDISEGGHFAALEVPNLLHKDFVSFVSKVEKPHKVTQGKSEL